MKRLLQAVSTGLLLLMVIPTITHSASPEPASPSADVISAQVPTLEVLSDSCYVFDGPRIMPHYFGPLLKGEKVKRLDALDGWTHLWIPRLKISGWVRSSDIRQTEHDPTPVPAGLLTRMIVTAGTVNIRSDARAQAHVLQTARKDQEFWLLNEKGGWYLVWVPALNRAGWIFGKGVSRQKQK